MKKFLILLLSLSALTASAQTDNVGRRKPTTSTAKPKPKTTPAKPKPATPAAKPTAKPAAKPVVPQDPPVAAETTGLRFAITGDATCAVAGEDYWTQSKQNIVIPPYVVNP